MKNTTLAEHWPLKGKSVNIEKSAVLNDTPTYFVRVVIVSAGKKKDSIQRHLYVEANMVQYTASQT